MGMGRVGTGAYDFLTKNAMSGLWGLIPTPVRSSVIEAKDVESSTRTLKMLVSGTV